MASAAVALHLADTGLWACSGEREWSGGTASGLAPLAFVDSGYIAEAARVTPVTVGLGELIRHAAAEVGAAEPVSLHVTAPTRWGTARREVVAAAAGRVASQVTVWPVAVAAAKAYVAARDVVAGTEDWLVVECDAAVTSVSRVRFDAGQVSVLGTDAASADEPDSGAMSLASAMGESAPFAAVLVVGECAECDALMARFGRLAVVVIEPAQLARALLPVVDRGPRQPVVHLTPRPAASATRSVGRAAALVAVVVLGALAMGAYVVLGRDESHPEPAPDAAAQGQELALGTVRVHLPPGWRMRTTEPATEGKSARLELVAQEGPDRRIIVTQAPLGAGVGYDAVVAELARLIAAGGRDSKFGALEPGVEFGGRSTIAYRESPDVYSHVMWHVMVEHDSQVSVGCQSLVGDWEFLAGECEQLIRTMVIVP